MLDKIEILILIFVLLLIFYFVISWGAKSKKDSSMTAEFPSPEITGYLFNVRILIIFIAVVALILWLFL